VDVRTLVRSRGARQIAAVLAYVAASCGVLGVVVWAGLAPEQQEALGGALQASAATLVLGALIALAGLAVLLQRGLAAYPATARRLSGDVRLVLGANPDHRLERSGPPELADLAGAVNELAERRAAAERDVDREVSAARADVEQERNRLAALMADLTVAVLVCSPGGRILLYNSAARALLDDDPALGLGRSVFGVVDRGLITHALDRIADGSVQAQVSSMLRGGQLLQVRLAPVRGGDSGLTGFVLLLEDTSHLQARRRRDDLLRALTESTRAAAAGIRAAVETVLDYPDMAPEERAQFLGIIAEESQRLGGQVEGWVAEVADLGSDWVLADMRGDDLLAVLGRELERGAGVSVVAGSDRAEMWLRADSHALARAAEQLAVRLRETCGADRLGLSLTPVGRHARLDVSWSGRPLDAAGLKAWLEEPLTGGAAASVREAVERHDAEVWSGADTGGPAYVRLLLPVTEAAPRPQAQPPAAADSRPELYDFDLFDLPEQALPWQDRKLVDLAYTVFDTETTGFHPTEGDQIVSIGAVRVVGGRLRRREVLEVLVDPGRDVPAASSAVHGITTEMVQGQPPLEQALPLFARFCEDMVLVGHNVGFDMSFLRAAEKRTGVRFAQPVLDTLLLDAAIHPDHERHSLEAMADRLGVDVVGRHTALGDALVTGEVFVRLLALLQQRGICTLGEALAASQATYQARLDARMYGG
jgi:DNA polymerase-3 subunit epsilon